jgi:glycine hydroxymethyltransferase
MIPYDPRPPMVTSGIRLGAPAATTRGMGYDEFVKIGRWIAQVAAEPKNEGIQVRVRGEVLAMVQAFPAPG